MTVDAGNLEQAQAWDGDEGLRWAQQEERYDASGAAHAVHLLRTAAIEPHDRVLDIGCGCGSTTREAAVLADRGHALGVDLSEQMLARARQRAAEQHVTNVTFVRTDAQAHAFEPSSFDVVISKFGVMFFADPVAAFTNMKRAVRSGGRLTMLTWQEFCANPWLMKVRDALAGRADLPAPPKSVPGPFGLVDPDHVRRVLERSGWSDARLTEINEPVQLGDDPEDAFTFVSQMGITRGLIEGMDEAAREMASQRLRAALREAGTDAGVALPSRSWLVEARSG